MRFLLIALPIIFTIYTLVDCAGTNQDEMRNLPKWGWLVLIIMFGILGSIGYWVAGRPAKPRGNNPRNRGNRILPPDDNPDFLKNL